MITDQEEFEDSKGVIRICKSKDRQHNDQKKRGKRTNSDLLIYYINNYDVQQVFN